MRRHTLYLLTALTTFFIGNVLFFLVQIYNREVGIRQTHKLVRIESPDRKEGFDTIEKYYSHVCTQKLHAAKKNANTSDISRCMNELEYK